MKAKCLFSMLVLSLTLCSCSKDENDIIRKLKSYDKTSPYTYEHVYEYQDSEITERFIYNESTRTFTCLYENWTYYENNNILYNHSVIISWVWGYLQYAEITTHYHNSNVGIIEMEITDFSFGAAFPAIKDIEYKITYNSCKSQTAITSANAYAKLDMYCALKFANDFCTNIHGSLSIR